MRACVDYSLVKICLHDCLRSVIHFFCLLFQDELEKQVILGFGSQALRVLLLAYRDYETEQDWEDEDSLSTELTLLAFVGIQVSYLLDCSISIHHMPDFA